MLPASSFDLALSKRKPRVCWAFQESKTTKEVKLEGRSGDNIIDRISKTFTYLITKKTYKHVTRTRTR